MERLLKYYVYIHRRNDTSEVFYVGKGSGRRAWRTDRGNDWWNRIVNKHGYSVEIVEWFEIENDSFAMERYLIASYKALGVEIVNHTDGGEGIGGFVHRDESKEKMSKAKIGQNNPAFGKTPSDATKAKLSETKRGENHPMFGKTHTDESKEKMSLANGGENHPMFGKTGVEHHSCKNKYLRIDKITGTILEEYIGKGALKSAGFHPSHVIEVTQGKVKHHKGFSWRIEPLDLNTLKND